MQIVQLKLVLIYLTAREPNAFSGFNLHGRNALWHLILGTDSVVLSD